MVYEHSKSTSNLLWKKQDSEYIKDVSKSDHVININVLVLLLSPPFIHFILFWSQPNIIVLDSGVAWTVLDVGNHTQSCFLEVPTTFLRK